MSKIVKLFKDSVSTLSALPISGNAEGDVRIVRDTGYQYYWAISSSSGSLADWFVVNDPEPSPVTNKKKLFHELLNEYKFALETFFESYSYTGARLTLKEVWTDNAMTTKLYSRSFSYTGSRLDSDTVTRISDGITLTRTYLYTGTRLDSVEYT